jgi:hypothetical protein
MSILFASTKVGIYDAHSVGLALGPEATPDDIADDTATRRVVKVGTVAMTTGRADKQRRHHRVVSDIVAACGQNRLTKSNVCRRRAPNDPPSGRRPVLQRSLQHAPVRTADQIEGPCAAAAYGCGYASRKALAGRSHSGHAIPVRKAVLGRSDGAANYRLPPPGA